MCFSPASGIIVIETVSPTYQALSVGRFSPASGIIVIETPDYTI
ncbi:hypothetical protein PL9631_110106 [Planktothrix paucivesiculata PCC 9631]|uniref:Uncharacterized protein n=1 Tax=Planktothrix paucivesiculata PCC 9631 TaxID=671071 RepID=A0A7Z9BM32_9CYAN|nr:hypothetical protein PL9631_110106 [Planktothrix paucivesiculata PCC 9631]